ncbi:pyrroline-5-carboxylate reductase [Helicobacter vulpis]|uniref:pyrroline-5-carboxylate reductase n=1 Tax=Helicobacter vulpis TaxID=2316076 RepID=UPI0013CE1D4D|nr:pyrroline-5-carboxylate reductase [Helicobacter vulpis]
MKTRLLVVGYGRMAEAMLRGFAIHAPKLESYALQITGRNPEKIRSFLERLPLAVEILPPTPILDIDHATVLLAIKPYALESFEYKGVASLVLSVLAGVSVGKLAKCLKSDAYARCMPNIASSYALSSTTLYAPCAVPIKARARALLECLGAVVEVSSEQLIDASLATNGSALAFLGMMAQGLVNAGVREGLSHDQAVMLVAQSFKGFTQLLQEKAPQEIIDSICTPGGATIAGLSVLEEKAFKGIIMRACHAVVKKGRTP